MLAALVIVAILAGALRSVTLLVAAAVPDAKTKTTATLNAAAAIDLIAGDLTYATSLPTMAPRDVQRLVPDRDNDGQPETIRYTWSGTPGDALIRTINGGTPHVIANNVQEFQLAYDQRTITVPYYEESDEMLLASYDSTTSLGDLQVRSNQWVAEYFNPALPANASSWSITRVRFKPRRSGNPQGQTLVQIRAAAAPAVPGTTVLDQVTLLESGMSNNYSWREVGFTASGLVPGTGACLVFQWANAAVSVELQYQTSGAAQAHAAAVVSANNGTTWNTMANQNLLYYIYGKTTTVQLVASRYVLGDVRCTLRTSEDPATVVTTAVPMLNQPPLPGP